MNRINKANHVDHTTFFLDPTYCMHRVGGVFIDIFTRSFDRAKNMVLWSYKCVFPFGLREILHC